MCTGLEIALISGAVSGMGAIASSQAAAAQMEQQAKVNEYNAKIAENKAYGARQTAAARESQVRRAGRRALSSMNAGYGSSGVTTTGTPLLVMSETVGAIELDALMLQREGNQAAINSMADASIERWQAASNRSMSKYTKKMGYVKAGTSMLMSYGGEKYGSSGGGGGTQPYHNKTSYAG